MLTLCFIFSDKKSDSNPSDPRTEQSGAGTSENPQYGAGRFEISDGLIDEITARLVKKHPAFRPVDPNSHFYEAAQPTQTSEVIPENTTPSTGFGVNLFQNDHNDSFDCKVLLKSVPSLFKQKATTLLNTFEQQPNDLTFDSNGVVFVDNEALPNSNIREIFPALFKKRSKPLNGLTSVLAKIHQMNLLHLTARTMTDKPKLLSQGQKINWWYLK